MRRTRTVITGAALAGVVCVGVCGAAYAYGWGSFGRTAQLPVDTTAAQIATGTASVGRTDVAERHVVAGTLGFADSFDVISTGSGVVTMLPAPGQRITRGQSAYEVAGNAVALFYGERPVWRSFRTGMTDGLDVQQLESNLKELGFGDGVMVDRHFSYATYLAVRRWQKATHQTVTGEVPLGQIVFLPDAVRVGSVQAAVGTSVQPGVVIAKGTSPTQVVMVQLTPTDLPNARPGDSVTITLPDGSQRQGKVATIGAAAVPGSADGQSAGGQGGAGSGATSTVPVTVTMSGPATGLLDRTQVQVAITAELHPKVLAVPATALRAVPGGSYQVMVVEGGVKRPVPVQTALFDEVSGLVEVSGPGLAEGQQVEVPQ